VNKIAEGLTIMITVIATSVDPTDPLENESNVILDSILRYVSLSAFRPSILTERWNPTGNRSKEPAET